MSDPTSACGALPAAPPAPPPRIQSFRAALLRRRRQPERTVWGPAVNGALGLLGMLICVGVVTARSAGEPPELVVPRLQGGLPLRWNAPVLQTAPGAARLGRQRLRAGAMPHRRLLAGRHEILLVADTAVQPAKLASWLTVFRQLGIDRLQLVVGAHLGKWRAIDLSLRAAGPARGCAGASTSLGALIDAHRFWLEQDPRATLVVGPSCLELVPRVE